MNVSLGSPQELPIPTGPLLLLFARLRLILREWALPRVLRHPFGKVARGFNFQATVRIIVMIDHHYLAWVIIDLISQRCAQALLIFSCPKNLS